MPRHIMQIIKHPTGAYEMTCPDCGYHYVAKVDPLRIITLNAGEDVEHVASTTGQADDVLLLDPSAEGSHTSLADRLFKGAG